ncbi:hypothetical protein P0D72_12765 [Paraburkholderia sediminicola]|uniref:hypothetical protein n=1 Tax=Paraburkholderia sediminicola TaxID=458836 RepID=UPI0038BBF0B3
MEGYASTIPDFCQRYKISKVHYYALKKRGDGPDELHLGRRRVITHAAELAWERRMAERQNASDPAPAAATPAVSELSAREDDLVKEIEKLQRELKSANAVISTLRSKTDFRTRHTGIGHCSRDADLTVAPVGPQPERGTSAKRSHAKTKAVEA